MAESIVKKTLKTGVKMAFSIRNFSGLSLHSMGFSRQKPGVLKEEIIQIGQYPIEGLGRPPRLGRRGDKSGRLEKRYNLGDVGKPKLGNIEVRSGSVFALLPSGRTMKKVIIGFFVLGATGLVADQIVRDAKSEARTRKDSNMHWRMGTELHGR